MHMYVVILNKPLRETITLSRIQSNFRALKARNIPHVPYTTKVTNHRTYLGTKDKPIHQAIPVRSCKLLLVLIKHLQFSTSDVTSINVIINLIIGNVLF